MNGHYLDQAEGFFDDWRNYIYAEFNKNFIEDIIHMRNQMKPREVIEPIDMLRYKKTLLKIIKDRYNIKDINFNYTNGELTRNRTKENMKITKQLTNIIKNNTTRCHVMHNTYGVPVIPELDFFHKLRFEDNEYYITADTLDILYAYKEIQTCLSAGGENQGHFIELLASPYFYLVTDKHDSVRMGLLIDHENKKVFMNAVYGSYDMMMPMAVIQHFVLSDYEFVKSMDYFHREYVWLDYVDSYTCVHQDIIEAMGFDHLIVERFDKSIESMFKLPKGIEIHNDLIIDKAPVGGNKTFSFTLWSTNGAILFGDRRLCESCGDIVDVDDYNDDDGHCTYCDYYYCEGCGYEFNYDEMHDEYQCINCYENSEEGRMDYYADMAHEIRLEERLNNE